MKTAFEYFLRFDLFDQLLLLSMFFTILCFSAALVFKWLLKTNPDPFTVGSKASINKTYRYIEVVGTDGEVIFRKDITGKSESEVNASLVSISGDYFKEHGFDAIEEVRERESDKKLPTFNI